jgi:transcriptional regulator
VLDFGLAKFAAGSGGPNAPRLEFAHLDTNVPGLHIGLNEVPAPKGSGSVVLNIGVANVVDLAPFAALNLLSAAPVQGVITKTVFVISAVPAKSPNALSYETLDALILKTLTGGPHHGYAIAKFIEDASDETVIVEEGSLYPALYRMERRGWVEAEWGVSELGRRAKLYRLTKEDRAQLAVESATWRQFSAGVSKILLAR